jgi:hypothetical protein
MLRIFKTYFITLAVAAFSFMAVYDTVLLLMKDQPVEISYDLLSESSKPEKEKEKEKEKEIDEFDELFIEYFFLSVNQPVISLDIHGKFRNVPDSVRDFYSEIIPPPPRA